MRVVALRVRLVKLRKLAPARLEAVLELLVKVGDLSRLDLIDHPPHVLGLVKALPQLFMRKLEVDGSERVCEDGRLPRHAPLHACTCSAEG